MKSIFIDLFSVANKLKTRTAGKTVRQIFCPIRKKWVSLSPEELVRQSVIHYLLEFRKFSRSRISVEKGFRVNNIYKRFDIVVFDGHANPFLLVECKAFDIPVTQALFDQLSVYNHVLQAPYLWATNGRESYICKISADGHYEFIDAPFPNPDR